MTRSGIWASGYCSPRWFVYLLMVVNYQTFGDPFVVILALPANALRHCHHAVHHRYHAECAVVDGERSWQFGVASRETSDPARGPFARPPSSS